MATIVTRSGKGSPLTNNEVDANFTNLNTELGTKANTSSLATVATTGAYADLTGKPTIASADGSVVVTGTTNIDLSVAVAGSTSNVVLPIRNTTGATLAKGTAVYISGATGQISTVSKAIATGDATSAQTLGLVTANIANNSNGNVTLIGTITNIDTSAYTDGQQLYLSPTTAGTLTATKPYAPQHLVYVAVVEHAHPSQGKLFVKVQNGYEMDELHDVSAQNPANNDGLFYNTSTSLWEKKSIATALGFTPYNATNPAGYITGITSGNVTTALGYTPANRAGDTFTGPITVNSGANQAILGSDGAIELTRGAGGAYIDFKDSTAEDFDVRLQASGNQLNISAAGGLTLNGAGVLTGITSGQVTTALGYTPYNATNPAGYITGSGSITGSAGSLTGFTNSNSANPVDGPDNLTNNGLAYVYNISLLGQVDGALYAQAYSTSWVHQIYGDYRTGQIALRGKNSGAWQAWRIALDSGNYTNYAMPSGSSATNSVDVRAPIFYDSPNSAYYLDPAGTSNLNQINLGDSTKFIRGGGSGQTILGVGGVNEAYLQVGGSYYSIWNSGNFNPASYLPLTGGTLTGDLGMTKGAPAIVFTSSTSGRAASFGMTDGYNMYLNAPSSGVLFLSEFRAPIMRDTDNSAYYINAADTSVLNNLSVGGSTVFRSDWTTRFQSGSDFVDGTLVTTDIVATGFAGESFVIEITGKSYSATNLPFKVVAQGYLYNDTIINYTGISYGGDFATYIKVFEEGGVLKFWWPRISYWNSFNVNVMAMDGQTNGTITRNRVTAIGNSTEPTGTKKQQINLIKSLKTGDAAGSISGFNNPTTAPTANTIAYRDAAGDIAAREIILSSGLSTATPTVLVSMFPTTNQMVRTTPAAVAASMGALTTSNYSSYALPITGGTLTGSVTIPELFVSDNTPTFTSSAFQYHLHQSPHVAYVKQTGGYSWYWRRNSTGTLSGADEVEDMSLTESGNLIVRSDVRAPLFYDSPDTSWFLDPSSTSVLNVVRGRTLQHSSGQVAVRLNGDTWTEFCDVNGVTKLWLGGSGDPNNYYNGNTHFFRSAGASGYGYINSGGMTVGPNISGEYTRLGGNGGATDMCTISASNGNLHIDSKAGNDLYLNWYSARPIWSEGAAYFAAYYDKNDTAYYLDPFNTGLSLRVNGNMECYARSAAWSEGYRVRVPTRATWGGIRFTRDEGNDNGNWAIGFTGIDSTDDLTFWGNVGGGEGMRARLTQAGILSVTSEVRAPIFRDSANSGYYADPDSISSLYQINTGIGINLSGVLALNGSGATLANGIGARLSENYGPLWNCYDGATWHHQVINGSMLCGFLASGTNWGSGKVVASDEMRAVIFRDYNNSAYFINPNDSQSIRTVGDWRADSSAWTGEFNGKIQYHANNWYFQAANEWVFRRSDTQSAMWLTQAGNINLFGAISTINNVSPPNHAIRLTPNMHINAGSGSAVILNWDNGTTSGQTLRVGNGAGSDVFNVYANGNTYAPIYYDIYDTSTFINSNDVSWIKGNFNISRVATGGDNDCFGGLELREVSLVANTNTAATYSPRVNFHWGAVAAATIFMNSGGNFVFGGQGDITNNRRSIFCNELYATGNVTAYYSDDRLKTRKGNIENALDIVSSLNGFRYVDNDLAKTFGYANNGTQLGVSAQEVQKHLPEIVRPAAFDVDHDKPDQGSKTGENYLTVDYSRMIPLLIEAIKELRHEVEMLKK